MKQSQKMKYYNKAFKLFLKKLPSDELYDRYFNEEDAHIDLQLFVNKHLKKKYHWMTGIGIMDAVDMIVNDAKENGNIR